MIEVINLTNRKIGKDLIVKTAQKVLDGEKSKKWNISVCLAGERKIRELNKNFRDKDVSTDVLSFSGLEVKGGGNIKEGQIIICPAEIEKDALKEKKSFQKVFKRALIHSILHLLGYNHEESEKEALKMRKKEEKYLKK